MAIDQLVGQLFNAIDPHTSLCIRLIFQYLLRLKWNLTHVMYMKWRCARHNLCGQLFRHYWVMWSWTSCQSGGIEILVTGTFCEKSLKNLKTCLWTCQLCSLICQRPYVDVNHYCCCFFSNHILLISVAVYVLINYCCILGYPPRLSKLWWVCRLCLYQNANIDVTRMK